MVRSGHYHAAGIWSGIRRRLRDADVRPAYHRQAQALGRSAEDECRRECSMTPIEMVVTSLLLGLFVVLAGCYGVLFCVGRLRANRTVAYAAYAAYAMQVIVAASLVLLTP